ncbi:hypothetical protein Tco_1353271 [Tanacetum coccineum]
MLIAKIYVGLSGLDHGAFNLCDLFQFSSDPPKVVWTVPSQKEYVPFHPELATILLGLHSVALILELPNSVDASGIMDIVVIEGLLMKKDIDETRHVMIGHEVMDTDLAERKEIDNVGKVSTIWKSGSVRVLKPQDG